MDGEFKGERCKYWTLFFATLQLSDFTFGGGFVIIPLMRRKFVEELKWIGEQEMLDLTAIAQSSPGAVAVNASILLGYRVCGFGGAMCAMFATVLPPLVILSVISFFYTAFRDNAVVNLVMKGMQAGVAAVICDVVLTMSHTVLRSKRKMDLLTLGASFLAVAVFKVNVMLVILFCAALGALYTYFQHKRDMQQGEAQR